MGFGRNIREEALVASARCCCVCREFKGLKVEVHHIIQEAKGGSNDFDNAIPLCSDCHTDAGHYNPSHPKGTKYSKSELKKHRDQWYKIVKEGGNLTKQLSGKHLICQYIMTSDRKSIDDILNNNIRIAYFSSIYYYEPEFMTSNISSFMSEKRINSIETCYFENEEEYLVKYHNIQKIEEDVTYYRYIRPFDEDELKKYNNFVIESMIKNGYSINQIIQRCGCYEPCGGNFIETIRMATLHICFLSIYNASDDFVQLNKVDYLADIESKDLMLPKVKLPPKSSVFIPLLMFAEPLDNITFEDFSCETERLSDYENQVFERSKIKTLNSQLKGLCPIGDAITPIALNYFFDSSNLYTPVHEFDVNNVYRINRYFSIGSCPHVFFCTSDNKIKYYGEIFCRNYGVIDIAELTIPINARKIIIAEIEYETTYIESVYIDEKKFCDKVVLNRGEYIQFDVENMSKISVKGFYQSSIDPRTCMIIKDKNIMVKEFAIYTGSFNEIQLTVDI